MPRRVDVSSWPCTSRRDLCTATSRPAGSGLDHLPEARRAPPDPRDRADAGFVNERNGVVVVGAGQAGLAVSHELTQAGVAHVVLERGRVGQTWRGRWDSFCLVTPNWSLRLPSHPYDGDHPDGFMLRDEVVGYLERYAAEFDAPVRGGVEVRSLRPAAGEDGFRLETSAGEIAASTVLLCTGAYQRPHRPTAARTLPSDLPQIDVEQYRNPAELPPGPVLVVGSASPAARSRRSSTMPGGRSFSPAGGRRGRRAESASATCSGGRSRPASSTRRSAPCRTRRPASPPTSSPPGRAAATTCTSARCAPWASRSSVTSWAPRAAGHASRRTSPPAWPGATSGTRSSWARSGSWSTNAGCRSHRSPSRSPSPTSRSSA